MRICTKCKIGKPNRFFSWRKNGKYIYRNSRCLECEKICRREYNRRARQNSDKNKLRESNRRSYRKNRDSRLKAYRVKYANNMLDPEYRKFRSERRRIWRERNPERVKEYRRRGYSKNRDAELENNRLWVKSNPDKARALSSKKRARKESASGFWTDSHWKELLSFYSPDGKCLCCRKRVPLTVDHVIPIVKGGSNSPGNLQPLCRSCNSRKNTNTIDYRSDKGIFAMGIEKNEESQSG